MNASRIKHNWQLENTYANLPLVFFSPQVPTPVTKPKIICFNSDLAKELALLFLNKEENVLNYLSGNNTPFGAKSIAQAYAGHQFGYFTMLGDGRAILLGEHVTPRGKRFDIQLKGSGKTVYSRRGDGRATLYSMLREYLMSESMHSLGIPTSRSLAVVSTGEKVVREKVHEGAVLTRIASSHIRIGTFEYASQFCSEQDLQALTNYTIKRHYPDIENAENPALELLKSVMNKQLDLIVNWMRVGFIHGVMNTDNMSIAGETIDYGPCAFMNSYNPKTVFSSIDTQGRYAFGNQPNILQWNLTIFAKSLLPMISKNRKKSISLAQAVIAEFRTEFNKKWYTMMLGKLGVLHIQKRNKQLLTELLSLMETYKSDYNQTFMALQQNKELDEPLFKSKEFKNWKENWESARVLDDASLDFMGKLNPKIIPRNHWVENVLEAAVEGDVAPFNELLEILSKPYINHAHELKFQKIPKDFDRHYQTFCGT